MLLHIECLHCIHVLHKPITVQDRHGMEEVLSLEKTIAAIILWPSIHELFIYDSKKLIHYFMTVLVLYQEVESILMEKLKTITSYFYIYCRYSLDAKNISQNFVAILHNKKRN